MAKRESGKLKGSDGWDDYAPFYDWENARTQGRRDVSFWRRLAVAATGPVLELGCGTGRIAMPIARAGVPLFGVDRSAEMLGHARRRVRRSRYGQNVRLVRGDIRHLPFADASFGLVMAPYGVLQSLLHERDLKIALGAVARVLADGGTFGLELVADLPSWNEYERHTSLRGRRGRNGARLTLIESVRQDRPKGLTMFDQEFVERRGREIRRKTFTLAFRTLSVPQMAHRLRQAGFDVTAMLGDYQGGPWDPRADAWILLAQKAS